ncbi:MAG: hypothetical protein WAZ27_04695 [Minisyncoccia bacterium]
MQLRLSEGAKQEYESLSVPLRKVSQKQFTFLATNIRHPSLRAKKYDESTGLWQARINKSWRFYFFLARDVYLIVNIRKHPK